MSGWSGSEDSLEVHCKLLEGYGGASRISCVAQPVSQICATAQGVGVVGPENPELVVVQIAAQCRGGTPVDPNYGPSTPMPQFPAYLQDLAIKALDSVIAKPTWLAEAWDESPAAPSGAGPSPDSAPSSTRRKKKRSFRSDRHGQRDQVHCHKTAAQESLTGTE